MFGDTAFEIREKARKVIMDGKATGKFSPAVVAYFALVHLRDEDGNPISAYPVHQMILKYACDQRISKLLLLTPPGIGKTLWMVSAFCGAWVGFYPQKSLIIASTSGPVADKRSQSLRSLVESDEWRLTFPTVKPMKDDGSKWGVNSWSLSEDGRDNSGRIHPTVSSYGTLGPIIGSRADLIVGDDVVDFESSRTENGRLMTRQWFYNSLLTRRKPKARVIVIANSWSNLDLYSELERDESWFVVRIPLLSDSNKVFATVSYPINWKYETPGEEVQDENSD